MSMSCENTVTPEAEELEQLFEGFVERMKPSTRFQEFWLSVKSDDLVNELRKHTSLLGGMSKFVETIDDEKVKLGTLRKSIVELRPTTDKCRSLIAQLVKELDEFEARVSLGAFIRNDPRFNRFTLLVGVCDLIRSSEKAYGALNADNVMIWQEKPYLSDPQIPDTFSCSDLEMREPFPVYMVPEQFTDEYKLLTKKADVYAFGVLICEVFSVKPPLIEDVLVQASSEDPLEPKALDALLPSRPNPEHRIWKLVMHCLEENPDLRPGLEEIHKILQGCESEWDSEWKL